MSGGGKGGQTETQTQIDPQLQAASQDALDYAATAARLPFTPNRGAQIAAPTTQMQNSMQGANTASSAFGMSPSTLNLPQTMTTPNGIEAYGSGGIYDQAIDASYTPEMRQSIDELFINPEDGLIRGERSPIYEPHYGGGKGQPAQSGLPNRWPYGGGTRPAAPVGGSIITGTGAGSGRR